MAYINPGQFLASRLQPGTDDLLRLFPTIVQAQQANRSFALKKPLVEAQIDLAQENALKLRQARNLFNRLMGGQGDAIEGDKTPDEMLKNPMVRKTLGLPAITYDTFNIYGPEPGQGRKVSVQKGKGYELKSGESFTAPRSLQRKSRDIIDKETGNTMTHEYDYDPVLRKEYPVGEPYLKKEPEKQLHEWYNENGEKFSDYFTQDEWSTAEATIRTSGGLFEKPELTPQKKTERINKLLDQKSEIFKSKINIRQKGYIDALALQIGQAAGIAPIAADGTVTPEMINEYDAALDEYLANIEKELANLGYKSGTDEGAGEKTTADDYIKRALSGAAQ